MYGYIIKNFGTILSIIVTFRLFSVFISIRNEKKLMNIGATEYGRINSLVLMMAHFAFYGSCLCESYITLKVIDNTAFTGLLIYAFAIGILYYVISEIWHVWTVKLIIAPHYYHRINKGLLFRCVKHPNYYLNIIPELIGFALIFHADLTLIVGLPLYLIPLVIRIKQEEAVMKREFNTY